LFVKSINKKFFFSQENTTMTRLVIITGASKGIGAQIALQTNAAFNSSTFLLIARNLTMLDEVKDKMAETENQNEVITLAHDFSKSLNIEKQKSI
jgi:short-subunit dehydrogenase